MSWNDFEIGSVFGNVATTINGYPNISSNSRSYWWTGPIIGGRVEINTPAGKRITKCIERGHSPEALDDYLLHIGLRRMSPGKIIDMINAKTAEAFENGKRQKAKEIRGTLGL